MLKLYVLNFNGINPLVDFIKGSFTIVSFVYKSFVLLHTPPDPFHKCESLMYS